MAGDDDSEMMLGDDFYGIEIGEYRDVRMPFYFFYQACLYFGSCIVFVMENAEFRMSPFLVQVKLSVFFFIEINAPFDQLLYLCRGVPHHFLNRRRVAYPVACHHRVVDMFFKIVYFQVGYRSDPPLGKVSVSFFKSGLAD